MITSIQPMNSPASTASELAASRALPPTPSTPSVSGGAEPFGDLFQEAMGQANQLDAQAHAAVTGLMTGSGVDIHQAMIASEKASMAFEMVLAVRNKAIQSYQSVMSMQF